MILYFALLIIAPRNAQRQALAAGGGFGRQKPKVENAQRG
jgi:hypothetical protein